MIFFLCDLISYRFETSSETRPSPTLRPEPQLNDLVNPIHPPPPIADITQELKKGSVVLVRKQTIPTERPPLVGEVSANFSG
jgi:hypothetical protein